MVNVRDIVRSYSETNIDFLMNSILNLKFHINNYSDYTSHLNSIRKKVSDPSKTITSSDLETIDDIARKIFSQNLAKRVFRRHDSISNKLERLWAILQEIYEHDPNQIVECVTNIIEKKVPEKMSEAEKTEFRISQLSKFLGTSKKANTLTDFIFEDVKRDRKEHKLDALSICGMLLSFVANTQTHLYFAMESIKEAVATLGKNHNIEEIFSLESPVMQNTKPVTDIRAIRNAVSHGSFNIEFNRNTGEWIIDFESILTNFQFNKRYTGDQLIDLYAAYDNLRNFQELLIRIALLKATLKIFFSEP
jgi:hypothetical protein